MIVVPWILTWLASAWGGLGAGTGDDWPCWRGAAGDGLSRETTWNVRGQETPLWRVDVGRGHSSSVVVGERLLTLGYDDEAQCDRLWCLDAESGEVVWSAEYAATLDANGHGGGTHTTPAVAAGKVYVASRRGEMRAYDLEDGKLVWENDLGRSEGVRPNDYGFGGSPLVLGERVLVNAARTFALDRETGEVAWRSEDRRALYSTPVGWKRGPEKEDFVVSFAKLGLVLLDAGDGAELGYVPWEKGPIAVNASTPVVIDHERIFFSSAYDHGCALVRFTERSPEVVWESRVMRTKMGGCVRVGERLYGFDESMLKAIDLWGKERWRKRGLGLGALSAAGGRLLVLSGRGELVVVDATAERYSELARRAIFERGPAFWSAPVLSGGRIYCRAGDGQLVCLDHRSGP